jgi:serine/threonine-protein kinase
MRVILEVIEGPQKGEQFVFDRHEAFVVGRKKNERVQFRIPDDRYFSRIHMLIEASPPRCFVRDLGSRNGTYVNENPDRIREAELHDGDSIRGGRTILRVRIDQTAEAPASLKPPAQPPAVPPEPDQAEVSGWDTVVFGKRAQDGGRRPLACAMCHKPPDDPQLAALVETTSIAYVCPECRAKHRSPQCPVPNYEKLATLAQGGLGPVYKARRVSSGKLVVLKLLAPEVAAEPGAAPLFLRQMLLSARLRHPCIVPVVEMGQAGDDLWIASEYVEGVDARELARRRGGALPPADAVHVVCQALDALEYAHGLNLVHRDVKPSNILVSGEPGGYTARLADFGLLRNMDEAGVSGITRKGDVRGTLPFMPPEQLLDCRFVKAAGDIYAAGATLYWLLTGEFTKDFDVCDERGERKDPYLIILEDPIVPIRERQPSVPEPLARAIQTALAQEPEDRFSTAGEMAMALRAALS